VEDVVRVVARAAPRHDQPVSALSGADPGRDGTGDDIGGHGLHRVGGRGDASRREAEHGIAVEARVRGTHRPADPVVGDCRNPVRLLLGELGLTAIHSGRPSTAQVSPCMNPERPFVPDAHRSLPVARATDRQGILTPPDRTPVTRRAKRDRFARQVTPLVRSGSGEPVGASCAHRHDHAVQADNHHADVVRESSSRRTKLSSPWSQRNLVCSRNSQPSKSTIDRVLRHTEGKVMLSASHTPPSYRLPV
jgi:hypothetical protein